MTPIAIQVEHLSKCYRIGQARARYGSLRDSLAAAARLPLRRPAAFKVTESTVTPNSVIVVNYERAGAITTGSG